MISWGLYLSSLCISKTGIFYVKFLKYGLNIKFFPHGTSFPAFFLNKFSLENNHSCIYCFSYACVFAVWN